MIEASTYFPSNIECNRRFEHPRYRGPEFPKGRALWVHRRIGHRVGTKLRKTMLRLRVG